VGTLLVLVVKIFIDIRYSTINNSAKKQYFSTKFSDHYSNLLGIKCRKLYSDSFRFDIDIVQCMGVYFFPDTVYYCSTPTTTTTNTTTNLKI